MTNVTSAPQPSAPGQGLAATDKLTTGQVARYCGVSRKGVLRWIQQGKLRAFRTPGGHYRIPKDHFRAFLEHFGLPVDATFFGDEA